MLPSRGSIAFSKVLGGYMPPRFFHYSVSFCGNWTYRAFRAVCPVTYIHFRLPFLHIIALCSNTRVLNNVNFFINIMMVIFKMCIFAENFRVMTNKSLISVFNGLSHVELSLGRGFVISFPTPLIGIISFRGVRVIRLELSFKTGKVCITSIEPVSILPYSSERVIGAAFDPLFFNSVLMPFEEFIRVLVSKCNEIKTIF